MTQPVWRRCMAPAVFLLVGIWAATWMAQPDHVPGDINRLDAALQRLHPRDGTASAPPDGASLTSTERSVQVAGKIGGTADVSIAFSLLAIMFGVLAGPTPRRWLFRLHRWSRFVAFCITLALGVGAVAELSPNLAIAALDLLPLALLLYIGAGFVRGFYPGATKAGGGLAKTAKHQGRHSGQPRARVSRAQRRPGE